MSVPCFCLFGFLDFCLAGRKLGWDRKLFSSSLVCGRVKVESLVGDFDSACGIIPSWTRTSFSIHTGTPFPIHGFFTSSQNKLLAGKRFLLKGF